MYLSYKQTYFQLTVSKFKSESTAFALAALSLSFISRRNLVLHSVISTVNPECSDMVNTTIHDKHVIKLIYI